MANLYLPQLFTEPAKTFDNPSSIGIMMKGFEQMNKMYYANKDNYYNNIKTPLDKVQVFHKNKGIVDDAKQTVYDMMDPVSKEDTFHKAESIIRNAGQYIATNRKLHTAISDYAGLQARQKIVSESGYDNDTKSKILARLEFDTKAVSEDKDGNVASGLGQDTFVEMFDDKKLKDLLSSVDSLGDYPVTEEQHEGLTDKLKSAGVGVVDDYGNPSQFVLIKNGKKYLDKARVRNAVIGTLQNSKEYQNEMKYRADLDMWSMRYNQTVKSSGKKPETNEDLVKFNERQLVEVTKSSPYDLAVVMNAMSGNQSIMSEFNKLVKGDKSVNMDMVDSAIRMYYIDGKVDPHNAFQQVYTNAFVNNGMSRIAEPIANRLAFTSTTSDMQIVANGAYIKPGSTEDKNLRESSASGMTLGVGLVATGEGVGIGLNRSLSESFLDNTNKKAITSNYRDMLFDTEFKTLTGHLVQQYPSVAANATELIKIKELIGKSVLGEDVTSDINQLDETSQKAYNYIKSFYNGASIDRGAFNSVEEYKTYESTLNQYNQAKYNSDQSQSNHELRLASAMPFLKQEIDNAIETDKWVNFNQNAMMDIYQSTIGPLKKGERSGFNMPTRSGNMNANKSSVRDYNKFIRENPNDPRVIKAKAALLTQAHKIMDLDDIYDNAKHAGMVDLGSLCRPVFNPPKVIQDWSFQSIQSLAPHTILYSSIAESDNKNDLSRFMKNSSLENGKLRENVTVKLVSIKDGRYGNLLTDTSNGDQLLVSFDMPPAQQDHFVRTMVDNAAITYATDPAQRSLVTQEIASMALGNTNVSINGEILPVAQADAKLRLLFDANQDATIELINPHYHLYNSSQQPTKLTMAVGRKENGRIYGSVKAVNGITDATTVMNVNKAYFPYDYTSNGSDIKFIPQGVNSFPDLIGIMFAKEDEDYRTALKSNK